MWAGFNLFRGGQTQGIVGSYEQVAERLQQVKSQLPEGLDPQLGPIATGLGEIFMYTIDADPKARKADGTPDRAQCAALILEALAASPTLPVSNV